MNYQPEPLTAAIIETLREHGFSTTAGNIESKIADGLFDSALQTARPLLPQAQQELAADVLETNIVMTYRAWEETVELITGSSLDILDDMVAANSLLIRGEEALAPLGSKTYKPTVDRIASIVAMLRRPPPPASTPGSPPPGSGGGGGGGLHLTTSSERDDTFHDTLDNSLSSDLEQSYDWSESKEQTPSTDETVVVVKSGMG